MLKYWLAWSCAGLVLLSVPSSHWDIDWFDLMQVLFFEVPSPSPVHVGMLVSWSWAGLVLLCASQVTLGCWLVWSHAGLVLWSALPLPSLCWHAGCVDLVKVLFFCVPPSSHWYIDWFDLMQILFFWVPSPVHTGMLIGLILCSLLHTIYKGTCANQMSSKHWLPHVNPLRPVCTRLCCGNPWRSFYSCLWDRRAHNAIVISIALSFV